MKPSRIAYHVLLCFPVVLVLAAPTARAFLARSSLPKATMIPGSIPIQKKLALRGGAVESIRNQSLLVGNISAVFTALANRSGSAVASAMAAFRLNELIPILALSFLPAIVLWFVAEKIVNKTIRRNNPVAFEDTDYLSPMSALLCQLGQLSLAVYLIELFMVFLTGLGIPGLANRSRLVASFVYGNYVAFQLSRLKAAAIERALRHHKTWLYRQVLLNRLVDSAIYLIAIVMFFDFNSIDAGVALKSIVALGGVSSVVVGLALKEPATEIIQGTNLLLSNKFTTGDVVKLSDGTVGSIQDLKWTDVTIRGDDDSLVRIPHTHMAKQRIINFSRQPTSQVAQKLLVPNKGPQKIKLLVDDIKSEIQDACPQLIQQEQNLARQFMVHWTDIEKDNVVITVQAHFWIPRLGRKYWDNRQKVLEAISSAVERYKAA